MDEAQQRTSSQRFTEWIAYQRIEPSGFNMDNWRMGTLAASIVNAIYASIPVPEGKTRPAALTPEHFFPVLQKASSGLTPQQVEYLRSKRCQQTQAQ